MDVKFRSAADEDVKTVGDLFAAHLVEQYSKEEYATLNPAFDAHWFIEAMLNPPVNHILLAEADGKIVGFSRMGVLYGDGLIPLEFKVKRSELNYLKRVPVIILGKIRDRISNLISRIEKCRSISSILLPTKRGYIADFYIVPDMRRKGIGRGLFDRSIEWFASKGLAVVELRYLRANVEGEAFWKTMGFEDNHTFARRIIRRETGK